MINQQINLERIFWSLLTALILCLLLPLVGCGGSSNENDKQSLTEEAQQRCHELENNNNPCAITDPALFLATYGPPVTGH